MPSLPPPHAPPTDAPYFLFFYIYIYKDQVLLFALYLFFLADGFHHMRPVEQCTCSLKRFAYIYIFFKSVQNKAKKKKK